MTRRNANQKVPENDQSLILSSKPEPITAVVDTQLPKSLIIRIEKLHADVDSIGGSLLIKSKRLGDYLRAAFNIVGHGQKTEFFERSFGHLFDLRTAQRYMRISHFVEGNMDAIRSELQHGQPGINVESMSDDEVLRMLPISSVAALIADRKKDERVGISTDPGQSNEVRFASNFESLLAAFITAIDVLVCGFNLQLKSTSPAALQSCADLVGGTPLAGTAILVAGNSRVERKAMSIFIDAFCNGSLVEGLILSTSQATEEHSLLHLVPEAIVRWRDLFSTEHPAKGFRDTVSISYLAPQSRHMPFALSLSTLCSVKLPYVTTK